LFACCLYEHSALSLVGEGENKNEEGGGEDEEAPAPDLKMDRNSSRTSSLGDNLGDCVMSCLILADTKVLNGTGDIDGLVVATTA
jgi:hypothetical protein